MTLPEDVWLRAALWAAGYLLGYYCWPRGGVRGTWPSERGMT